MTADNNNNVDLDAVSTGKTRRREPLKGRESAPRAPAKGRRDTFVFCMDRAYNQNNHIISTTGAVAWNTPWASRPQPFFLYRTTLTQQHHYCTCTKRREDQAHDSIARKDTPFRAAHLHWTYIKRELRPNENCAGTQGVRACVETGARKNDERLLNSHTLCGRRSRPANNSQRLQKLIHTAKLGIRRSRPPDDVRFVSTTPRNSQKKKLARGVP